MGLVWPGMEFAYSSCFTIRLTGCVSQPPDSVPPQEASHAGLAGSGQQLSSGRAAWTTVEAQHQTQAGTAEGLQLCPLHLCVGAHGSAAPYMSRDNTQGLAELELGTVESMLRMLGP